MKPFLLGAVAGLLLAGVAVGVVTWWATAGRVRNVKRDWALGPVVVVSKDLNPGDPVTFDALVQRDLPEQFVTGSFVTPADAEQLVGKRLSLPLHAGDVLTWSDFIDRSRSPWMKACAPLAAQPPADSSAGDETSTGPARALMSHPGHAAR